MNPHALWHSLNTNFLLAGLNNLLAAEYLSWQHQEEESVQSRYTHVYAENMRPVAIAVDQMYGTVREDNILEFRNAK
ncbi:MAG: hypothetical protein M0P35_09700 [Bacteroidales bacterium]|jgi:hypothetical protein|nr:hypothetical protein [Bacteroidales bacterium]